MTVPELWIGYNIMQHIVFNSEAQTGNRLKQSYIFNNIWIDMHKQQMSKPWTVHFV